MPLVKPTVWTIQRRVLGNVVPALFWVPLASFGLLWMAYRAELTGLGLWFLFAASMVGWFSLNQFGLFQNSKMRRHLERLLKAKGEDFGGRVWFVGFASPRYSSLLDAHEDVGFLRLLPDRLRFRSETRVVELMRDQIVTVRFRMNVHSLVGLGRWVSVEAIADGQPIRLLLEVRDRATMLANLKRSRSFLDALKQWMSEPSVNKNDPSDSAGAK